MGYFHKNNVLVLRKMFVFFSRFFFVGGAEVFFLSKHLPTIFGQENENFKFCLEGGLTLNDKMLSQFFHPSFPLQGGSPWVNRIPEQRESVRSLRNSPCITWIHRWYVIDKTWIQNIRTIHAPGMSETLFLERILDGNRIVRNSVSYKKVYAI